jgi:hypothetical protein
MSERQAIEAKAQNLRNSYEDCSVRISDFGPETVGIKVTVRGEGLVEIELDTILEDIDRELYEDGYNTAWITEDPYLVSQNIPEEEWESQKRIGRIAAIPAEDGEPDLPDHNSEHTNSHRNIH